MSPNLVRISFIWVSLTSQSSCVTIWQFSQLAHQGSYPQGPYGNSQVTFPLLLFRTHSEYVSATHIITTQIISSAKWLQSLRLIITSLNLVWCFVIRAIQNRKASLLLIFYMPFVYNVGSAYDGSNAGHRLRLRMRVTVTTII